MELINNRYRIIKPLKHSEDSSSYLCSDMWDGEKSMKLNIINDKSISSNLIDYYINEFIGITRLNNDELIRNYSFNIVSEIDNKVSFDKQYMYTTEYLENPIGLLEYIKDKDVYQIMDIFINICKTINYLHLKGYVYGALNLNNIFIFKDGKNYKLKLKDIPTVKLEEDILIKSSIENRYFQLPKSLNIELTNKKQDIYSLGVLLLTMLKGNVFDASPSIAIKSFIRQIEIGEEIRFKKIDLNFLKSINVVLEKMLFLIQGFPYDYVYEFIEDINKTTNNNYSVIDKENLEKLNFHTKIVGRDHIINVVKESYNNMIEYKSNKRIYLVEGDHGIGKTRLLREFKFILRLKAFNVYSSFRLKGLSDDKDMWEEILGGLILESDKEVVEKYKDELKNFASDILDTESTNPIEKFKDTNNKYRLLNRIAKFIVDSIKNKPSVIIINNIHLADGFTLDTLTYLYSEIINHKNLILILSYEGREMANNTRFSNFISDIKMRSDSDVIYMDNLNLEQTGELIKNTLTMSHTPIKLAEKVYSKSYGNPLFITEIIKELYSNKKIYVEEQNGLWYIDLPESDIEYEELDIPNSIEQVILNQLKGINHIEHKIINMISIFYNPIVLDDLNDLLVVEYKDIEYKDIEANVQILLNKGILFRGIEDAGYVYDINNKALKDIIYETIPREKRIEKHKSASEVLESKLIKGMPINLDELIYHLERSDDKDKVKNYLIRNSKERYSLKDVKSAIKNLEKALSYTDKNDKVQRTEFLLRIGEMYFEIDDINNVMKCYDEAEILADEIRDKEKQGRVYVVKAQLFTIKMDQEKFIYYLDKTAEILETIEYLEVELEYKSIIARRFLEQGKYNEAINLNLEVIEKCGDRYIKIKGNAKRNLAYIYVSLNRFEEAIELYQESIELLNSVGFIRGVLYAINNIGSVYYDNYQDTDTALEYFIRVKDISKEYGLLSSELLGLTNVGVVFYDKYEYTLAYEYLENALKKSLSAGYKKDTIFLYNTLANLCLDMNEYRKAYEYYNLSLENSEDDKPLIADIELVKIDLFYTFGRFHEALKYAEKAIITLKNKISSDGYMYSLKYYLIKILVEDLNNYDLYIESIIELSNNIEKPTYKVIQLSEIAIALYKKDDYENAKRILEVLESSMTEKVNDNGKIYYYYAKAIIQSGEDTVDFLYIALKLAKRRKSKLFIANIKIKLGDYYYDQKDYYYAVNYYIGTFAIIKNIIYDIPDEYKLDFVNNYNHARFLYRLGNIKDMLLDGKPNNEDIKVAVSSLEELSKLLANDYNCFANNKMFMKNLREFHINKSKENILDEKGIIANLGTDIIKNIELILKNFATITVATKGLVVIEENHELSIIASINEENNLSQKRYIFDRLKTSMKPILISNKLEINENDHNLLEDDIKACMCIPISNSYYNYFLEKKGKDDKKDIPKILGYLYLETDNVLNNFNNESLIKNIEIINLMALLCEKYQLKKIATIDKLTGALTRKYLEDGLNNLVNSASRYNGKFSIIMYDLDRFKRVNDRFGHQTGDEVLKKVSKLVMDNIDKNSSLGRYGGEEFIIMVPDADSDEALVISNELREKIYKEKILGDRPDITVSMGVSTYPIHGNTAKELIEKADQALYNAKENGRNRCEIWNKNIVNKAKPITKLDGIITGDDVQDSRNILAIVETIQLMNNGLSEIDKAYSYLGRIIEIMEAQYGYLIFIEDGEIREDYGRKSKQEEWLESFSYNKDIVKKVVEDKQGIYMIDWDDVKQKSLIAGLPMWNSILVVPLIRNNEVKGVTYLLASTKIKEFGINDLNLTNVFSNLLYI